MPRPLNAYTTFVRDMYPTAEVQKLSVRERIRYIAAQWRALKAANADKAEPKKPKKKRRRNSSAETKNAGS